MKKHRKPAWWIIDTLIPLLIIALVLVHHLPQFPIWHYLLQIVVISGIYGLMFLWVRANAGSLSRDQINLEPSLLAEGENDQVYLTEVQAYYRRVITSKKQG